MKKLTFLVALLMSVTTFAADYVLVKEKTELQSGDVIVLANEANSYVNGPIADGTSHFSAIKAEFHGDTVTAFGAAEITLNGGPGSCSFQTAQGTVSCAAVAALTTEEVSTGSWNLNFDTYYNDGTVEIFWHTNAFANSYMKFNSQLPGFKNYKSGSLEVHIYKKIESTTPYVSVLSECDFGQVKLNSSSASATNSISVDAANVTGIDYYFASTTDKVGTNFNASGSLTTTGGTINITFNATTEGTYSDILWVYDEGGLASRQVTITAKVTSSTGDGSKENPYTCADITKLASESGDSVWVIGYIVGQARVTSPYGYITENFASTNYNVALADEVDGTNMIPVSLKSGCATRTDLHLYVEANQANIGKQAKLYGAMQKYANQYAIKNASRYELIGVDASKVTGVSLNKTTAALECGEGASTTSVTLTATIRPTTAANKNVTWTSSADSVATVSAEGVVTAVSAGEATIYVMTEDGEYTATCAVTVTSHVIDDTEGTKDTPFTCAEAIANQTDAVKWVKGFIVGVPYTIEKNSVKTLHFRTSEFTEENKQQLALADDLDGTNLMPIKLQNNSPIIDSLSLYLRPENIGKKIKIRGALTAYFGFPGMQNASEFVWLDNISVNSVSLNKTSIELQVNEMATLVATILPADADNKHVVWTSSNPTVASVDDEGNVTALTNGDAVITVKTVDSEKTATCSVKVSTASGEVLMGDIITADTTGITTQGYATAGWDSKKLPSGTIYAGKSMTSSGAMQIAYSGSEAAKNCFIANTASVGFIRKVAIIVNSGCNSPRTLYVYASNAALSVENLYSDAYNAERVDSLVYDGTKDTLSCSIVGDFEYVAVRPKQTKAMLLDKVIFTWAIEGQGGGIDLTGLTLDQHELTLEAKQTAKVKATYTPTNATYKAVTWTTSNASVATVNGGTITAVAEGKADIIVTSTKYPTIADTCHVTVTKEDIFKGRDIYYKITSLDELHNHDSIIFVNLDTKRVSAAFETYEKYDKTADTTLTLGRIASSETEVVVEGDSIGSWGAEEVHLVQIEGGKWKIMATVWGEEDEYGNTEKTEVALRATATNKLMLKGEGVQTWTIDIVDGNAIITSTDSSVGRLQFNTASKTFTTYTSDQAAIQIYRKKNQTTSEEDPEPDPDQPDAVQQVEFTNFYSENGTIYGEGEFQIFTVTGIDVTSANGSLNGIYIVRQGNVATKLVVR